MYTARKASSSDITQIAKIHLLCFPKQFMALLGPIGLAAYYHFFVQEPPGICFVATIDKDVIGFVSGWKAGATYQKPLVRQCGAVFAEAILGSFFKRPIHTYLHIKPRLGILARFTLDWLRHNICKLSAIANTKVSQGKEVQNKTYRPRNASLLSIAVLPEHRGKGVADMLNSAFVQECCCDDVSEIWLTVHSNNLRARSFYERNGWYPFRQNGGSVHYKFTLG